MSRFLVTGGCGFIGSHLVELLLQEGHGVRVLDDLSTGKRENLPPRVELVVGDVADRDAVQASLVGMDGCFHLAAVASVERCRHDWLGTHRTNQTGAITVLDCARATPDHRAIPVVYASSAAVYGDGPAMALHEDLPLVPLSVYGADKLGCELHARVASSLFGVTTVGLRFFNVFGPRQDPKSPYSGVISIFCDRLRQGLPITIFGSGQQLRDFVYVGDVAQALWAAMATPLPAGCVLNVCTGVPTSIVALANTIAGLLSTRPTLEYAPARPGDIALSVGDPLRTAERLHFRAATPLAVGLAETLRQR